MGDNLRREILCTFSCEIAGQSSFDELLNRVQDYSH